MNRAAFLKRVGAVAGMLVVAKEIPEFPMEEAMAAEPWNFAVTDSLIASGGLCAPLSPIYDLPAFPVRDALPSFQAKRGGFNVRWDS